MPSDAAALYLDLLKRSLTFSIWGECDYPIGLHGGGRLYRWSGFGVFVRLLKVFRLKLVREATHDPVARMEGYDWPLMAHTMIGWKRLENLQQCIETVLRDGVEGDLIETGVWRGGACIFMRGVLKAHGITNRTVWVADSFEGLPPPDTDRYPTDAGSIFHAIDFLRVSLDEVKENFARYGLLDDQVHFLKGWFKDTLPGAPIQRLAILRLDGDMYESTIDALTSLYPKVSKGGYVIIDDYDIHQCKAAVEDFRAAQGIVDTIHAIDRHGVYWRRSN